MNVAAIEPSTTHAAPGDGDGTAVLAPLLARTLPAGSAVAVGWNDPLLGAGCSLSDTAAPALRAAVACAATKRARPVSGMAPSSGIVP